MTRDLDSFEDYINNKDNTLTYSSYCLLRGIKEGVEGFAKWLCKSKYREIDRDSFSWFDSDNNEHIESIDFVVKEYLAEVESTELDRIQ